MSREEGEERQRDLGVVAETLRTDILQVAEGHEGIRRELQEMRKLTDKSASHLCYVCARNLHNGSHSTESMECIESSQALVRKEKTGKPSQNQAIVILVILIF
ncbi:MAG: hypothetical protein SGJ16_07280 [Nitrospirota bacterium]|nr:hypothetical protein [Nitrospirota bacterium]